MYEFSSYLSIFCYNIMFYRNNYLVVCKLFLLCFNNRLFDVEYYNQLVFIFFDIVFFYFLNMLF